MAPWLRDPYRDPVRSWLVIPAMGAVSAGAAIGLGAEALTDVLAVGGAGAALTAAIRALIGDSPASLAGAVLAPLLLLASLFEPSLAYRADLARVAIAIAAAGWTVVELARPTTSPLVALLPACVAGILDASFVSLIAIAGSRLMTAPWQRPSWAIAVPIAGTVIGLVALFACFAHGGMLGALGDRWTGGHAASIKAVTFATLVGTVLGPMTAVAALAGLSVLARRRHAEVAIAACIVGAVLVSARNGMVGAPLIAVACLSAGLAVGRLAGLIRLASGQAVVGATAGVLLLVPPAWTAIEHGARVTNDHASR